MWNPYRIPRLREMCFAVTAQYAYTCEYITNMAFNHGLNVVQLTYISTYLSPSLFV